MYAILREYLESLTYHTAPEDQGQIIEYADDPEIGVIVRRITDRSGTVRYEAIGAENVIGEFAPGNGTPQVAPGASETQTAASRSCGSARTDR